MGVPQKPGVDHVRPATLEERENAGSVAARNGRRFARRPVMVGASLIESSEEVHRGLKGWLIAAAIRSKHDLPVEERSADGGVAVSDGWGGVSASNLGSWARMIP
jgi:hypothetical protein